MSYRRLSFRENENRPSRGLSLPPLHGRRTERMIRHRLLLRGASPPSDAAGHEATLCVAMRQEDFLSSLKAIVEYPPGPGEATACSVNKRLVLSVHVKVRTNRARGSTCLTCGDVDGWWLIYVDGAWSVQFFGADWESDHVPPPSYRPTTNKREEVSGRAGMNDLPCMVWLSFCSSSRKKDYHNSCLGAVDRVAALLRTAAIVDAKLFLSEWQ